MALAATAILGTKNGLLNNEKLGNTMVVGPSKVEEYDSIDLGDEMLDVVETSLLDDETMRGSRKVEGARQPTKDDLELGAVIVRQTCIHPQCFKDHPEIKVEKVPLKFVKTLDDFTANWSRREQDERRKLLQLDFAKVHKNFEIDAHTVAPGDYDGNPRVVLCIWWQEMSTFIVTSVDIINILEQMVRQRFSIEEKNRVRRNLQLLKPMTVSKLNKKHSEFFATLMAMDDPRPRSIEKDIKVFRWSDFGKALEKVVAKYTWNIPEYHVYIIGDSLPHNEQSMPVTGVFAPPVRSIPRNGTPKKKELQVDDDLTDSKSGYTTVLISTLSSDDDMKGDITPQQ